ncbi:unnamed protein product [Caenorhabditis auriculariae]|uniref:Major facilitator superfamily (MFS) profile domain-containing protein n=1 Tax=Caenorhabditis auriculariae TaxID=2777116 RepID=A0A8S1H340_9PELO|nr:unnamed protein product [Caenorhabditis auriculariae]
MRLSSSEDLLVMGRYSFLVCTFTEIAMLSQLSNTMYMVYAGTPPRILSCKNQSFATNEEACQNYETHCNRGKFELESQFEGIVEEFSLHCSGLEIERMGTSIQMIGLVLGCLFFGAISDRFGRKWPMFLCLVMCAILGAISSLTTTFWTFTGVRTVLSFFNGGQSTISVVFLLENVPKSFRMLVSTLISFSPNVIFFGFIAFLCPSWRALAAVVSSLILPSLCILPFLHESPRWMMQKGKIAEAQKAHSQIMKFNGMQNIYSADELTALLQNEYDSVGEQNINHSFKDLFKNSIFGAASAFAFSFFSSTFINYGNMFNLGAISGSIFLNSILIGFLRYSVSISCGLIDQKYEWFNRRLSHFLCVLMTAASLIISFLLKYYGNENLLIETVVRICVLVSCAMTSQVVIIASVACNEFMPTAVRTKAYSIAQLSSRLGIVLAPHIFTPFFEFFNIKPFPYLILFGLCVLDVLFFQIFVPETKNRNMRDHVRGNKKPEDAILLKEDRSKA